MAENGNLILSNKQIMPTDDYIFSIIGEKKILWQAIMSYVSEKYNDTSGSWNYYNDGKQWLFKLVQKKKTIHRALHQHPRILLNQFPLPLVARCEVEIVGGRQFFHNAPHHACEISLAQVRRQNPHAH